jgi:ATP-dependent protease HslVU (ClpYQ) peptidase subunit
VTCVCGIVDRGAVHLGADSIAIAGYTMEVRATPKVVRRDWFVIGCAGSFRAWDVLAYRFAPTPPPASPSFDLHRYMATDFVDELRTVLKAHGVMVVENNAEEVNASLIVGIRGRLFTLDDDLQVGESTTAYAAIGCGRDLALGALYAVGKKGSPRSRLTTALRAAQTFSAGVRAPFRFATLPGPSTR